MYYELKWIEWPSGEEWFGIANTKEQIEEMIEDAANDEEHDFEYCGYFKVGEDTDRCRHCVYLSSAEKALATLKLKTVRMNKMINSVG